MELLSFKEKKLLEQLDKTFGDRESAKDIKNAIFLSQTNRITEEVIEQYRRQKEKDLELIRQQFTELNPSYAFDYPKETETIILSNNNINDVISEHGSKSPTREFSNLKLGGNEDVISINEEHSMHSTEWRYEK
jgi:hypothetical protein